MNIEKLKFPIGQFEYKEETSLSNIHNWMRTIENFPQKIEQITQPLTNRELAWRYRPDGWCIKQVVHHCADSHMNSFIRFKLALTEHNPTIRPYEEQFWAEMIDEIDDDLTASIQILKGIHHRWVKVLKHLTESEWNKTFIHPASQKIYTIKEALGLYAWHCEHHYAHVEQAIANQGDFGTY